jgi:hypothetical protein
MKVYSLFLFISFSVLTSNHVRAQKTAQIRSILSKIESYKYSNIFVFKVNEDTKSELLPLLSIKKPTEPPMTQRFLKEKDAVIEAYNTPDFNKKDKDKLKELRIAKWEKIHDNYFSYLDSLATWQNSTFKSAYIITNRFDVGQEPNIISLITSKSEKDVLAVVALGQTAPNSGIKDVYLSNPDLVKLPSPRATVPVSNDLKEYLSWRIAQNDVENVTAEVQGIDGETKFLPQKYGTSYAIQEDDIQKYLRITEGQPLEYEEPNELTIGFFDVIRFRHYGVLEDLSVMSSTESTDNSGTANSVNTINPDSVLSEKDLKNNNNTLNTKSGNESVSATQNKKFYNYNLPLYGVELKYGLPEINYPSLWSERMTLSVMWQSNKFGIILPTNGWSSLATDLFSAERKLTNAGLGIYGSLDFPIKLLNQGGVFNFNGSYVFGDAAVNPVATQFMFAGRNASGQSDSASYRSLDLSYLPRFHAQAHYSFAIDIDRTAFFRFKLGATMYVIQRFAELEQQNGNDENGRPVYEKKNRQIDQYSYDDLSTLNRFDQLKIAAMNGLQGSEVIAGLSGRIEFMNRSRTVPWGASMQFFDGSISGDVWAQVRVTNAFNVKLQAQYFQAALRDPKPWEVQTIVLPSLQLIFNF